MKKLNVLFATVAAALITTSAMAQVSTPTHPAGKKHVSIEQRVDKMAKALNLTERQEKEITTILRDERKQAQSIHKNTALAPDVKKAKLQQLHKDSKNAIKALLTKEQIAKLKAMHPHKGGTAHKIQP